MAAHKGKGSGGKKKKGGKNKTNATSQQQQQQQQQQQKKTPQQQKKQSENAVNNDTPEYFRMLQQAVTAFLAVLEQKMETWPRQYLQTGSMIHAALVVINTFPDRAKENVETLVPIFDELCDGKQSIWAQEDSSAVISFLSDKLTKWASDQGILSQYTRTLVEGQKDPFGEAPVIVHDASRDYTKLTEELFQRQRAKENESKDSGVSQQGPSLDSMIEALSASGIEVKEKEALSTPSNGSLKSQPKDPQQVTQAFLMFKPYMSQMIEARRKAEQDATNLQAQNEKLTLRIRELEQSQEPPLLSKDVGIPFQPDPQLKLETNTREFMKEHFKAFLSQYSLREKYFEKLLKARSSETAVQIMKVKKYRELSRAGWKMASEALDSLSKVDTRIQTMKTNFADYKAMVSATINSLVQQQDELRREYKNLELKCDQSKNKAELMDVMMNEVVLYNTGLKHIVDEFKELAEIWRDWAEIVKPTLATVLRPPHLRVIETLVRKTEELLPRVRDGSTGPKKKDVDEILRLGYAQGKTVAQMKEEYICDAWTAYPQELGGVTPEKFGKNVEMAPSLKPTGQPDSAVNTDDLSVSREVLLDSLLQKEVEEIPSVANDTKVTVETALTKKAATTSEPDGYEGDVDEVGGGQVVEDRSTLTTKQQDPSPKQLAPVKGSRNSPSAEPTPDNHLTVYSPVVTDDEDNSREDVHDDADGEDDDDFGFRRYAAHDGDVSSEEDEYFLRAKFGICYHDRYSRKGKASAEGAAVNSYMKLFGGSPDKAHNLCNHDMSLDFGNVRFADRKGHLFSEILVHDYVQSDDDTSMQNWTDEVEWEEGGSEEDEEEQPGTDDESTDGVAKAVEKARLVKSAVDIVSGSRSDNAKRDLVEIDSVFSEVFSEREWSVIKSGSLTKITPLLLSYMVAAYGYEGSSLELDKRFPAFIVDRKLRCWSGAIATVNFLLCYYSNSNGYKDKYGWDPIPRTIYDTGDVSALFDLSCKIGLPRSELDPILLFCARALAEIIRYPISGYKNASEIALREELMKYEGDISVQDLYHLVVKHNVSSCTGKLVHPYTTLLDALVCAFESLYTYLSEEIKEQTQQSLSQVEQTFMGQVSSSLKRCIAQNVYPRYDATIFITKSVQERVASFLSAKGTDNAYNKVVVNNRPLLMRALDNNKLDVRRMVDLHDAYEKLDKEEQQE